MNSCPGLRPHQIAEGPPRDVVGPIVDMLFPDKSNGRIPIAAITGTNGKTTTARMLAHILSTGGSEIGARVVGLVTTDGVQIDGQPMTKGDFAGGTGARVLLRDPLVEVAVLETARGGIVKGGLAFDWCDVGAVLNVTADHLGLDGIESLEEMAAVKGRVAQAARKLAVLNADDPQCLALAEKKEPEQVCLFSGDALTEGLRDHLAKGGTVISQEDGQGDRSIVLHRPGGSETILSVGQIPATLNGAAQHNALNAQAAIGLAIGLGLSRDRIAEALITFESSFEQNPGRLNVYSGHSFTVILDFAHNPDGARVACEAVRNMNISGRRICLLGCIGLRHAEHIDAVCGTVANQFDTFICTRNKRISEEREWSRGFPAEEIPQRISASLIDKGADRDQVLVIDSDKAAVNKGLELAQAGDILLVLLDDKEWAWERITHYTRQEGTRPS